MKERNIEELSVKEANQPNTIRVIIIQSLLNYYFANFLRLNTINLRNLLLEISTYRNPNYVLNKLKLKLNKKIFCIPKYNL